MVLPRRYSNSDELEFDFASVEAPRPAKGRAVEKSNNSPICAADAFLGALANRNYVHGFATRPNRATNAAGSTIDEHDTCAARG